MAEDEHRDDAREPNRLIDCTSPYLQQHAHNPVDWYPWGPEALERARSEDKPILLSIGYSACHWCHVMAHESFEDPETARFMNENFVNVKVDREERPDLDELYMRAVQLMSGRGGWPMTVFLMPDLKPFYGGTYFAAAAQDGTPSFRDVMEGVRLAYAEKRSEVTTSSQRVLDAIRESVTPAPAEGTFSEGVIAEAMKSLAASFDMQHGGFSEAPKFPQVPALEFLLRIWARSGDPRAGLMLGMTLRNMADGGIFDHLGGGFHRYSVDALWRVPHFEKMLCDNALLVGLYADAHRAFGEKDWLWAALLSTGYVLRELRSPEGAFFSSQDADTEGEEGSYYAWTRGEVLDCLGKEQGEVAARFFGVEAKGNWEAGKNVLYRSVSLARLAGLFRMRETEAAGMMDRAIRALTAHRRARRAPGVDRKVLCDWNALTVSALARVHRATGDARYLAAARECADFLTGRMREGDMLLHSWRDGKAGAAGFLSDHAMLAAALLDLYEATFEPGYLREALDLAQVMHDDYWDGDAGFFTESGRRNEQLVASAPSIGDQPVPAGGSVACHVLLRLAALGRDEWHADVAHRAMKGVLGLMEKSPAGTAHMISAVLRYLSPSQEFAIVGLEGAQPLLSVVDRFYLPHMARAGAAPDARTEVPLLDGKEPVDGLPTAFVCSGGTCRAPVTNPSELRDQLRRLAPRRKSVPHP